MPRTKKDIPVDQHKSRRGRKKKTIIAVADSGSNIRNSIIISDVDSDSGGESDTAGYPPLGNIITPDSEIIKSTIKAEQKMVINKMITSDHFVGGSTIVELYTLKGVLLRLLIEVLKEILLESAILFDKSGIKIRSVAMENQSFLFLDLDASGFDIYNCVKPKTIGINTNNLHRSIKRIGTDDILSISLNENDINRLNINSFDNNKNFKIYDKLRLIDIDFQNCVLNRGDGYTVHFRTNAKAFQSMCRDLSIIGSDIVEITVHGESITFKCMTDQFSRDFIMGNSDTMGTTIINTAPDIIVNGRFNLKQIIRFSKCSGFSTEIRIDLANNKPIIIEYDVSNMGKISLALT